MLFLVMIYKIIWDNLNISSALVMFEIVKFSSILTLASVHHVTLTINDLKNIFVVSIIQQTDDIT